MGFAGRRILSIVTLICVLWVLPPELHAQRSWSIPDFHSTVSINEEGSTVITERITASFIGHYNGIYRTIPINYPGPGGSNYTLFLNVLAVTDDQGHALKYESKRDGDYKNLKIYIPGAEDTTKTVVLTYSSPNAVRWFDGHDEFYWNVTGNDWPVPISHASAYVSLPPNTAGSLRAQAFTGVFGSHDQEATSDVNGATVTFETTNPLPMRGGLTIDVYIPKTILHEPGQLTKLGWWVKSNPISFLPFWTFAVMFVLWYYKGRDPRVGLSVAPMYEPPKGITPAEAGTLLDDSVDPRDITSTIVDLAVRGFVQIKEVEERGMIFTHKDYDLTLLKMRQEWSSLASHERLMLTNIFAVGDDKVRLSTLKNHFYTAIPLIKKDVLSQLRSKGMYLLDPESAPAYVLGGVLVIAAPIAITQWLGAISWFEAAGPVVVAVIVSLVFVFLFGRQMTAKTILGQRTRIGILGFQEFMNRVDKDRLQRMPPDTFEKYLPYAMALGVENRWAQAFAGIVQNPPNWYVGSSGYPGTGFNPIYFTNSMHSMTSDMHDVFVSAPRASSSGSGFSSGGGFSGGGSSGGGFGGGGGGAF